MNRFGLLASVVLSAMGCAGPIHLMDRGASAGVSPYSFWPPPPASVLWLPPTPPETRGVGLGTVASDLEASLVGEGYPEARWYAIGADYQHGFAVTTRLEGVGDSADSAAERWSALYPEPANLRWLTFARTPTLPQPGQYRAYLIAFTDLPMSSNGTAPIWNEQTVMDGPGAPERRSVAPKAEQHRVTPGYRIGVYEYSYDWDEVLQRGRLNAGGSDVPKAAWPSPLAGLAKGATATRR